MQTVRLLEKFINPLADAGTIDYPEAKTVILELRSLARRGTPMPVIEPKLITQKEAAALLGTSYANFKRMEAEGYFEGHFRRRTLGNGGVRFRNTDVYRFIELEPENFDNDKAK